MTNYFEQRMAEIKAEMAARPAPSSGLRLGRKKTECRPGYVYFLRAGNTVKIGFTTDLKSRQRTIRTSAAGEAFICRFIEGDPKTEARFHKRFAEYHLRGEWFDLRGELAKYLERHIRPIDLPPPVVVPERIIDL